MVLKIDNEYNDLVMKYPNFNLLLMLDSSSGHGTIMEGSLNVYAMRLRFGEKQEVSTLHQIDALKYAQTVYFKFYPAILLIDYYSSIISWTIIFLLAILLKYTIFY